MLPAGSRNSSDIEQTHFRPAQAWRAWQTFEPAKSLKGRKLIIQLKQKKCSTEARSGSIWFAVGQLGLVLVSASWRLFCRLNQQMRTCQATSKSGPELGPARISRPAKLRVVPVLDHGCRWCCCVGCLPGQRQRSLKSCLCALCLLYLAGKHARQTERKRGREGEEGARMRWPSRLGSSPLPGPIGGSRGQHARQD